MKFEHLQGSIVAMVTPFRQDGGVNFDVLTELLERQIAAGTDGILTLGTTGEYSTMSHEEDAAVVEHTIRVVDGRVPVIVGSGSNCTATQIEKSILYQNMGADALLLIAPYYNKANAEGMYRHFAETADAVHIPCILYNVPSRTGVSFTAESYKVLAQNPKINGVKEASGNFSLLAHTRFLCPDDFYIWSGNDDQVVPMMSLGAKGVISVASNIIPEVMVKMSHLCLEGQFEDASKLQIAYMDLIDALFCEAQGRLHARYAATYDCNSLHYSLMSYIVSVGQQLTTADAGLPIYFPLRPRYLAAGSYSTPILSSRGSTSTWCICIPSTHGS